MNSDVSKGKRVAVVTGATSGIGYATAVALLELGINVVGIGRRGDRLKSAEYELSSDNAQFFGVEVDLTEPHSFESAIRLAKDEFNVLPSCFIISAGIGLKGTLLKSDETLWESLIKTNYYSVMKQMKQSALTCLDVDPEVVRDIVVIGSTAGSKVSSVNPVYGSTKFAIASLVEALRQEVCHENIRVTLIEPGFVKTEFQQVAEYDPAWVEQLEESVGPFLKPEAIANVISHIVSQSKEVNINYVQIKPSRQKT